MVLENQRAGVGKGIIFGVRKISQTVNYLFPRKKGKIEADRAMPEPLPLTKIGNQSLLYCLLEKRVW